MKKVNAAGLVLYALVWSYLSFVGAAFAADPKAGGSGASGSATQVGQNASDLITKNAVPLSFALAGVVATMAIAKKSVAIAVAGIAALFVADFFFLAPDNAQSLLKSTYDAIF